MKMCEDEVYLAIISGKLLIKNEQQPNQLDIFIRDGKTFNHQSQLWTYTLFSFFFDPIENSRKSMLKVYI